jgi:ABC-type multidrug transport system fused ATPase/permease subunit
VRRRGPIALATAYADEPDRLLLDGVSFTVRRGERLGIVDRIVVIGGGRVAEQGSKDQLWASPRRFAEMWGLQRAGLH